MNLTADTTWRLTHEPETDARRKDRWRSLPKLPSWADPRPDRYDADEALLDAANTALYLGKPLLLTGEPGCGKTEFANHLAWRLGVERSYHDPTGRGRVEYALRFDTKSESRARDLFYTIDQVQRFQQAQSEGGNVDPLRFMDFQAFGRAILYGATPNELAERLPPWQTHPGVPRRSVVLIDEVDKAPRDFPNDLLMEMENMRFFIPELQRTVVAEAEYRPIIVITSNSEKTLPDAFLRRCVYYNIEFPSDDRLKVIVARRLEELPQHAFLLRDAIAVFSRLHSLPLRKRPGTAELLDFVQALGARGFSGSDRLADRNGWQGEAAQTLLKIKPDQEAVNWEEISTMLRSLDDRSSRPA